MRVLLRGGRVYAPSSPAASALLVQDGRVRWLGGEDGAGRWAGDPGTVVIDLDGALLAPAFVDAHVHLTETGLARTALDLRGCRSLAEALDAVAALARRNGGRPVFGGGWNETDWPEHRPPTSTELDRAAYGGLVYLARVDIHSAVVSSSLAAAVPGLAGSPGAGADGWIREPAHDAVRTAALAAMTSSQRADAQRAALRQAAAHGVACVHEMAGPVISGEADLLAALALSAAGDVPEVIGYWGELMATEAARDLGAVGAAGDLFVDGSLGSATAALTEPYLSHPETAGITRYETEQLAAHVLACHAAGVQAGFHAIGDAAVDQTLTAFELASQRLGRSAGAGHRIEHVEYVTDPARLGRSGLLASMQPCFDALWGGPRGMYAQRLGPERAAALNRFGELAAAGVPLAFGSDSPVTELGPWAAIRAAVHPFEPAAAVSTQAAFAAHTAGGWRAAGRTGGVLAAGAPATFAIWSVDRWGPDGLPDLRPGVPLPTARATVRDGVAVHDDGVLAAVGPLR